MNNYDRTLELIRMSTNSAGEANRQYAIYLGSVEAAQKRSENAFEEMSAKLTSDTSLKVFYSILEGIYKVITALNPQLLIFITTIGSLIASVLKFKVASGKIEFFNQLAVIGPKKKLPEFLINLAKTLGFVEHGAEGAALKMGVFNATVALTIAAIAALLIILGLAYAAWKAYDERQERAAAEAEKYAQQLNEEYNALKNEFERYEELNKIVNKTAQEKAELVEINKQILDDNPDLLGGIDAEGNAYLVASDKIKQYLEQKAEEKKLADIDAFEKKLEADKDNPIATSRERLLESDPKFQDKASKYFAESTDEVLEKASKMSLEDFKKEAKNKLTLGDRYKEETWKDVEDIWKKVQDINSTEVSKTRIFVSEGIAKIASSTIDELESQGKEISTGYREMVSLVSLQSTYKATDLTDDELSFFGINKLEYKAMNDSQRIVNYSKIIQDKWLEELNSFAGRKDFEKAISEWVSIKDDKTLNNEQIEKKFEKLFGKFNLSDELNKNIKNGGLADLNSFTEEIFENFTGDDRSKKSIEKVSKKLSSNIRKLIGDSITNLDDQELKNKLIQSLTSVFTDDFNSEISRLLDETDMSSPTAVRKLRERLLKQFSDTGIIGGEDIVDAMVPRLTGLERELLKKVEESIKGLKGISGLQTKNILTFEEAMAATVEYGAEMISMTDDGLFIANQDAINAKKYADSVALIAHFQGIIDSLTDDINFASEEEEKIISKKIELYNKIIEQQKEQISNLNIMTGFEAISGTTESLKNLGSIYTKLEKGPLSFIEGVQEIVKNPSLIKYWNKQTGAIELTRSAIIELANDSREATISQFEDQKDLLEIRLKNLSAIKLTAAEFRKAVANDAALSGGSNSSNQKEIDKVKKEIEDIEALINAYRNASVFDILGIDDPAIKEAEDKKKKLLDLRKEVYDALREQDQKDLDAEKERFDKLTEMENKYLDAVKKAIDKERALREKNSSAEDLAKKKRQLAVLERDTSGTSSQEAMKLAEEIANDEQDARDAEVDRQYEALQAQYEVQQEQRDIQIQMREELIKNRDQSGYYWTETNRIMNSGSAAILGLLRTTEAYKTADPTTKSDIEKAWTESISGAGVATISSGGASSGGSTTNTTTATKYPGTVFGPGSSGENVKKIQKSINDLISSGILKNVTKLVVDGIYGKNTAAAVVEFQKLKGLSPDGKVGSQTWPALVTKYKEGGLVDYTGPAWVDGSRTNPESFLDATDTKLIAGLRDLLRQRPVIGGSASGLGNSISVGDITVNLANRVNASEIEVGRLVRQEILSALQGRVTVSIPKTR